MKDNTELREQMTHSWNPWHGCHRISEGCEHCYLFGMDNQYGYNSERIKLNKSQLSLPIRKVRASKGYKIKSGSIINTAMMSDFFIEDADIWREGAWDIIHQRKDCLFYILTKRVENIKDRLPANWLDGWNNVIIGCTVENQLRADERLGEFVLNIPCKHKHIIAEPLLEEIDIRRYICGGDIEQVTAGGESCPCGRSHISEARECNFEWIQSLADQCKEYDVNFLFHQTGTNFIKDGQKVIVGYNKYERQLAPFYKVDNIIGDGYTKNTWVNRAKDIELELLAEEANRIYNRVKQERPEYEQLTLDLTF